MFGEVLQEECKEENVSARLAPYLHFMKIFENIVLGSLYQLLKVLSLVRVNS